LLQAHEEKKDILMRGQPIGLKAKGHDWPNPISSTPHLTPLLTALFLPYSYSHMVWRYSEARSAPRVLDVGYQFLR
jgi:hypothetical protein